MQTSAQDRDLAGRVRRLLDDAVKLVGELDEERRRGLAERLQLIDELNHSRDRSHQALRPILEVTATIAHLDPHLQWMRAHRGAWAQANTDAARVKAVMNARAVSRKTAKQLIELAIRADG